MPNTSEYIYGSTAPKLEPKSMPRKKQEETIKKSFNREQSRRSLISKDIVVPKGKILVTLSLVFMLVFMLIYRYTVITELNYSIEEITDKYNVLLDTNQKLRVDIEQKTDLENIELIAKQKLGMHKPDKYQIVCLNVPKTSYTTVVTDINTEEKNLIESLSEKLCTLTKNFID